MKRSKMNFRLGGVLTLFILVLGCTKTTEPSDYTQSRFLKLFENSKNGFMLGIIQNSDGSYFMGEAGAIQAKTAIIHAGKYGEFLSKQEIELGPNEYFAPVITRLHSGELVFTSSLSSRFTKLNASGEILVNRRWSLQVGTAYVGTPFLEDSDNLLIAVSEYNTGGTNVGVFRVDPLGEVVDVYNISLASVNKAIFTLAVVRTANGKMLLVGDCKPLQYKYTDKAKLFVAEFDEATETLSNVMVIDEFEDSEHDFYIQSATTANGFVVLCAGTMRLEFPGAIPRKEFELLFMGDDLQLLERRRYDVGAINVIPSDIIRTKDQGFLVSGYTASINQRDYKGFMAKIASDGQLEHSRIFPYLEHFEIYNGIETSDGDYMFSGGSLSFGNGKEALTPVVLKTNSKGQIQ